MPWKDGGNGEWVWDPNEQVRNPKTGSWTPVTRPEPTIAMPQTDPPSKMTTDAAGRAEDISEDTAQAVRDAGTVRNEQTSDIVDRYSAVQLDTGPADRAREMQDKALGMQEQIYNKLLDYDPKAAADAASKRAMNAAMVQARSAGGGAGGRQAAMFQALQQTPGIQAEAARGAVDTQTRNTQLAAQAATSFAGTAQGQRGQDISQAQAEVDTGLSVANGISNAIGRDMQLTSDDAKFLGTLKAQLERLNLDWAGLSEQERAAKADEAIRNAGLEQQWKQFRESQKVGVLDVIGAITGTARSAVGTYAAGKQSGLFS